MNLFLFCVMFFFAKKGHFQLKQLWYGSCAKKSQILCYTNPIIDSVKPTPYPHPLNNKNLLRMTKVICQCSLTTETEH